MKKSGVDYKKYKKDWRKLNPGKRNVLLIQERDPRFVKPASLLTYEHLEDFKLFDDRKDSVKPDG